MFNLFRGFVIKTCMYDVPYVLHRRYYTSGHFIYDLKNEPASLINFIIYIYPGDIIYNHPFCTEEGLKSENSLQ